MFVGNGKVIICHVGVLLQGEGKMLGVCGVTLCWDLPIQDALEFRVEGARLGKL